MKKALFFVSLILLAFVVTSCSEMVVPVAYTRYKTTGDQYAYYSADMVGIQLSVYKDEEEFKKEEWLSIADIEFSFNRCCGADTLDDGNRYTLVDLSKGITYTTVYINKENFYSESKSIFLNGEKCVPDKKEVGDTLVILTFNELPYERTNKHGRINQEDVNIIEYK